jgi:tetratricopeptide (TPR) repeat protein
MLRAGDRLIDAGRRALDRDVARTAHGLLERGLALTRPLRYDLYSEFDLARSCMQDPASAAAICADAVTRAAAAGDDTGQTLARAMTLFYGLMVGPGSADELERLLLEVRRPLEAAGDHAGLAHVWWALGFGVANSRGRADDWANASLEAYRHSRLSGRAATPPPDLGAALCVGSRPADAALEIVDRQLAEAPSVWLQLNRCWLLAMLGRAGVRQLGEEAYARLREQEDALWGEWILAEISSLADDHEDAVNRLRALCEWIESKQQFSYLPYYVARVARSLALIGRFDEAEHWANRARTTPHDADNLGRGALARVHAARGEFGEAERLAREGVEALEETQWLIEQTNAVWDLAEVLAAANRADEAAAAFDQALDRARQKKNVALAAQMQRRWDELARG